MAKKQTKSKSTEPIDSLGRVSGHRRERETAGGLNITVNSRSLSNFIPANRMPTEVRYNSRTGNFTDERANPNDLPRIAQRSQMRLGHETSTRSENLRGRERSGNGQSTPCSLGGSYGYPYYPVRG